jgi:hypothetical protein
MPTAIPRRIAVTRIATRGTDVLSHLNFMRGSHSLNYKKGNPYFLTLKDDRCGSRYNFLTTVTIDGTHICRLEGLKIAEAHANWNLATMMAQLGVIEVPKEASVVSHY